MLCSSPYRFWHDLLPLRPRGVQRRHGLAYARSLATTSAEGNIMNVFENIHLGKPHRLRALPRAFPFGDVKMNFAQTRRVIVAGMIGNVLEWYDFAVYGYFATAIGQAFFPNQDRVAQLLSAFGVFALGYLMRPLGGAVTGHIGDRFGRRAALTFSVVAMAIPTFLIGLLPGYKTLGLLAPIALTFLRVVQGLSVGGEYTSSMVFLVEQAPKGRRGLMGGLAVCGATAGILLGSAVGAGFAANMSAAALAAWGWRIPFLLGLLVGAGGYILRRQLLETI